MYGSYKYAEKLFACVPAASNFLLGFNYSLIILEALKSNLQSVAVAAGFDIDITHVYFGDPGRSLNNLEVLIYRVRDVGVVTYSGNYSLDRNSFLLRSEIKLRNLYVTFRLKIIRGISSSCDISLIQNCSDSVIKALYGSQSSACQLKFLLYDGISKDFGLVAYEVLEIRPYYFSPNVDLVFECLFQYKQKYY